MGIFNGQQQHGPAVTPGSIEEVMGMGEGQTDVFSGWTPPPGGPLAGLVGSSSQANTAQQFGPQLGRLLGGGSGMSPNRFGPGIGGAYIDNPAYQQHLNMDGILGQAPAPYLPVHNAGALGSSGGGGAFSGQRTGSMVPYSMEGPPSDWRNQGPSSGLQARLWEAQFMNGQSPWNWPGMEGWSGEMYSQDPSNLSGFGMPWHPFGNTSTAQRALNPSNRGSYLSAFNSILPLLAMAGDIPQEALGALGSAVGGISQLPAFQPYRF